MVKYTKEYTRKSSIAEAKEFRKLPTSSNIPVIKVKNMELALARQHPLICHFHSTQRANTAHSAERLANLTSTSKILLTHHH